MLKRFFRCEKTIRIFPLSFTYEKIIANTPVADCKFVAFEL